MSVIESIIDIPAEHEKKIYGNFDENIKKEALSHYDTEVNNILYKLVLKTAIEFYSSFCIILSIIEINAQKIYFFGTLYGIMEKIIRNYLNLYKCG